MKSITLITGGSSGLGLELARLFAREEELCLVSREPVRLHRAAQQVKAGRPIFSIAADCAREDEVKRVFETLHAQNYSVTKLISCVGLGKFGLPTQTNEKDLRAVLDSNLLAVILPTTYALRDMEQAGRGKVITVLSTAAQVGKRDEAMYCAAKWGARGYCEALKSAYRGTDIQIMTVSPGGINTPFWKADCGKSVDASRLMEPCEVARLIFDCTQRESSLSCKDLLVER